MILAAVAPLADSSSSQVTDSLGVGSAGTSTSGQSNGGQATDEAG